MAGPFAPDVDPYQAIDAGGVDPSLASAGPTAPDVAQQLSVSDDHRRKQIEAAQKALMALAMLAPFGRSLKGILGGAGAVTAGTLGLEALKPSEAQAGQAEAAGAPGNITDVPKPERDMLQRISDQGKQLPGTGKDGPVMPVYKAPEFDKDQQMIMLQQQLKRYQDIANKGSKVTPETQTQIDKLNAQIQQRTEQLEGPAKKSHAEAMTKYTADTKAIKDAEDYSKAQEMEGDRNRYRMLGLGVGAGTGALLSFLGGRKGNAAVRSFEKTAGDISNITKREGNVMVSKGNAGPDLQAGVNQAYRAGGAKEPFPSMADIYSATKKPELEAAKDSYLRAGEKIPSSAPFAKPQNKLSKAIEYGLPAGFLGDAAGATAAGYTMDNPDSAEMMKNIGQLGLMGAGAHLGVRKLGSAFMGGKAPNELAMRAVNAGRARMEKDVASVPLKSVQAYSQATADNAISRLPKQKGFQPGDKQRMQDLRDHKATTISNTRLETLNEIITNAKPGDDFTQAVLGARNAQGQTDKNLLRYNLRQIYGPVYERQDGRKVKVDASFVRQLMKIIESK